MADNQSYEVVKGFSTENGEGRYDYDYLLNKPNINGMIEDALEEFVPPVDATLKQEGAAADAAATGNAIKQIDEKVGNTSVGQQILSAINSIDYPVDSVNGKKGDVKITKKDIELENVEDKSSERIRSEITKDNVTAALGYAPPTVNEVETAISDAIGAINYPVVSVNEKTDAVMLNYDDVGAVSKNQFDEEIELKADVVKSASGEMIVLDDSAKAPLQGLKVFGKTIQNGDPEPDNPAPLESVGDSGNVTVKIGITETDENPQILTIQKPTNVPVLLPGIPVDSGGNYTDSNDHQWLCDEIDFDKGVYERRIGFIDKNADWQYSEKSDIAFVRPSSLGFSYTSLYLNGDVNYTQRKNLKCNVMTYSPSGNGTNTADGHFGVYDHFYVKNSNCHNASEYKAWMKSVDFKLTYILPKYEEINLSEIDPNIMAQYEALHTNYPNTMVHNNSGAHMSLSYATPSTSLPITGGNMGGTINMRDNKLTGIPIPENEADAVNKSYADEIGNVAESAKTTADWLMVDVNALREAPYFKQVQGEMISVDNAADAPLQGLKVFGKTIQNGEPTPDNPVPLKSVDNIRVHGKNLLSLPYHRQEQDGKNVCTTDGGVTYTVNDDGSITLSGTNTGATNSTEYIIVGDGVIWLPVGKYTLNTGAESFTENLWYFGVSMYTGKIKDVNSMKYVRGGKWTFDVTEAGYIKLLLRVYENISVAITVYPQLEIGTAATEYVKPVSKQILPISTLNGLPGIPVTSGGNHTDTNDKQWVCDEVDFEKNLYIQRVKLLSVDGSIGRISSETIHYMWLIELTDGKKAESAQCEALCSHCVYSPVDSNNLMPDNSFRIGTSSTSGTTYLYLKNMQMTNKSDWVKYLGEKKMTVLYQLETPILHKLSEIDPNVLTAYAKLRTNSPHTTIYNDSNATMQLAYATPTSLLPISGGSVDRLEVPTPTKPNEAATKDYVDKHINTVRDIISNFHSNIENEVEGEVIQVNDSAKAPIAGMRVLGKTEQKTTTGKNLYDITTATPNSTKTNIEISGNTIRISNTDTVSFSGAKSKSMVFEAGTTYVLSCEVTKYVSGTGDLRLKKVGSGNLVGTSDVEESEDISKPNTIIGVGKYSWKGTFIQDTEAYVYPHVTKASAAIGDITFSNIQLEVGSEPTDYEPYTGGIPSPNPDYPQELESVGYGGMTAVVAGTNLIDKNKLKYSDNNDGTMTITGEVITASSKSKYGQIESKDVPAIPGATMYLSCKGVTGGNNSFIRCCAVYADKDPENFGGSLAQAGKIAVTVPNNAVQVRVRMYINGTNSPLDELVEASFNSVMLSYADVDYEPGKDQTLPVPTPNGLPGIPVTSGGNYTDETGQRWICDEIDFENDVYRQWCERMTFTGSENWQRAYGQNGNPNYFYLTIDTYKVNNGGLLTTHFIWNVVNSSNANIGAYAYYSDSNKESRIAIRPENIADLDVTKFKNWLNTNNMTCVWALTEPKEIPLSEIDPNVLAQYAALHTNYPNTTIYNDSNAHMNVRYIQDTKMYVDKKFAELAEIILNKS